jgi:hypothetical protein
MDKVAEVFNQVAVDTEEYVRCCKLLGEKPRTQHFGGGLAVYGQHHKAVKDRVSKLMHKQGG